MIAATYLILGYAFLHFINDRHMPDESMRGRAWIILLWPLLFATCLLLDVEEVLSEPRSPE